MRAVLHAHSDWSYDGSWTLPSLARLFGRLGVDTVFMTEHDTGFDPASFDTYRAACAEASAHGATLVPGIEYSCPNNDIHILTWGLEHFLAEHRPVPETLRAVRAAGGVSVFAHPARRDVWRIFDADWVPLLDGIEIWNRKTDGLAPGEHALEIWQDTGLAATVGMDFHRLKHLYPLSMDLPAAPGAPVEVLSAALRARTGVPLAFGAGLTGPNGGLRGGPMAAHGRAEALRRGLKRVKRRVLGQGVS